MNYLPSSRFVALTTRIAGLSASRFAQTENRLDKVKLSIKKFRWTKRTLVQPKRIFASICSPIMLPSLFWFVTSLQKFCRQYRTIVCTKSSNYFVSCESLPSSFLFSANFPKFGCRSSLSSLSWSRRSFVFLTYYMNCSFNVLPFKIYFPVAKGMTSQ